MVHALFKRVPEILIVRVLRQRRRAFGHWLDARVGFGHDVVPSRPSRVSCSWCSDGKPAFLARTVPCKVPGQVQVKHVATVHMDRDLDRPPWATAIPLTCGFAEIFNVRLCEELAGGDLSGVQRVLLVLSSSAALSNARTPGRFASSVERIFT